MESISKVSSKSNEHASVWNTKHKAHWETLTGNEPATPRLHVLMLYHWATQAPHKIRLHYTMHIYLTYRVAQIPKLFLFNWPNISNIISIKVNTSILRMEMRSCDMIFSRARRCISISSSFSLRCSCLSHKIHHFFC